LQYTPLIPAKPHGGEVAPAQLPDHTVLPVVDVPNLYRVVATWEQMVPSGKHLNTKTPPNNTHLIKQENPIIILLALFPQLPDGVTLMCSSF